MQITELFLQFALLGAEWVMWVLVGLSVLSVGVMIERGILMARRRIDAGELASDVRRALREDDVSAFKDKYGASRAMPARVALRAVQDRKRGIEAVSEAMNSEKTRGRAELEDHLIVLGTLGNNAPFIGLFGTVLGIIGAFDKLSQNAEGGANMVMAEIAEALAATAVGLLVAIPAVVAFNYFNRRVRASVTATDEIAHAVLGELHGAAAGSREAG